MKLFFFIILWGISASLGWWLAELTKACMR